MSRAYNALYTGWPEEVQVSHYQMIKKIVLKPVS